MNAGADVLMVALALLLAQAGQLDDPALAGAMFGAVLVALTPELRLVVGRMLDRPSVDSGQ